MYNVSQEAVERAFEFFSVKNLIDSKFAILLEPFGHYRVSHLKKIKKTIVIRRES